MNIEKNLEDIKKEIKNALESSPKQDNEVTIIGVTKTINIEKIQELVNLGIKNLGENKVQELLEKYDKIKGDVNWHFIGHLQTNKVKYIIDKVEMIHSVDSLRLVKEIDKQAKKHNKVMDILVQVNIGDESSKFGIQLAGVDKFIKTVQTFDNVNIKGLMCIAPYTNDVDCLRNLFSNLFKKYIDIFTNKVDNRDSHLSMGMSNDYKIAIKEGSNMVRLGTSIFGQR